MATTLELARLSPVPEGYPPDPGSLDEAFAPTAPRELPTRRY